MLSQVTSQKVLDDEKGQFSTTTFYNWMKEKVYELLRNELAKTITIESKENGEILSSDIDDEKDVKDVKEREGEKEGSYEKGQVVIIKKDNVNDVIIYGIVNNEIYDNLLSFLRMDFLPFIKDRNFTWSGKKEYLLNIEKFLLLLTEVTYRLKGSTELYIPDEKINYDEENVEKISKDIIERYETCLIQWTTQIRELIQEKDVKTENKTILDEIDYWKLRTKGLVKLKNQLESKKLKQILKILKNSSYLDGFLTLSDKIQKECDDSLDNLTYLSTLKEPCLKLSTLKPKEIPKIIPDILKKISMIWALSKNYNTQEKITSLLKKVSNEIIIICSDHISLECIFTGDVEFGIKTLNESSQSAEKWKVICIKTLDKLEKYYKKHSRKFEYEPTNVFAESDGFVNRCEDLLEVCQSRKQFCSELPLFGGSRADEVRKSLIDIKTSFENFLMVLKNLNYSILDIKASKWHDDIQKFKRGVRDLELIVLNVLNNAFQSVKSIKDGVELIEAFHTISNRESLKRIVETKQRDLFDLFEKDLLTVRSYFENNSKSPPIKAYHPKFSGKAHWANSMLMRISSEKEIIDKATFLPKYKLDMKKDYDTLYRIILQYIEKCYDNWKKSVKEIDFSTIYDIPIFVLDKKGYLEVNLNKDLVSTINEMKYFEKLGFKPPESLWGYLEDIKGGDAFVTSIENVKAIARGYNDILLSIGKVKDQKENQVTLLFKDKIGVLDEKVVSGLTTLNWSNSTSLTFFLKDCSKHCLEMDDKILNFTSKKYEIYRKCETISKITLVEIDPKVIYNEKTFIDAQRKHRNKIKRNLILVNEEICKIMKELYGTFSEDSEYVEKSWWNFVGSIETHIEKSLKESLKNSLKKLSTRINTLSSETERINPLFLVNVILVEENETKPVLSPRIEELESLIQKTQYEMITCLKFVSCLKPKLECLIEIEQTVGDKINIEKELRKRKIPSYYENIKKSEEEFREVMISSLSGIRKITKNVQVHLKENWRKLFKDLWNCDKDSVTRRMVIRNRPSQIYDQEYSKFQLFSRLVKQKDQIAVIGYLQLDFSTVKQKITDLSHSLMNLILDVLHKQASKELYSIYDMFEQNTKELLEAPRDRETLKSKMKLLRSCKKEIISEETEGYQIEGKPKSLLQQRYAPILSHYEVLRKYEKAILEDELVKLENLETKGFAFEKVVNESEINLETSKDLFKEKLEKQIVSNEKEVKKLKEELISKGPYKSNVNIELAKVLINDFRNKLKERQKIQNDLKDGCRLFQITMKSLKELKEIDKDLSFLGRIWKFKEGWEKQWSEWKSTTFKNISVKEMETGVSKFLQDLNLIGRDISHWDVWSTLKTHLNLFKKAFPLIIDLKNEAIRKRHWQDLCEIIPDKFDPHSDEFNLENILNLGFHNYAEDIANISNAATQELNIELEIQNIIGNWRELSLTFKPYREKYIRLIETDDIFETLNDDSVTLGAMKLNPFIKAFLSEANYWEKTLSRISEILELVLKVQSIWMYLLNIFMVEDIMKQLPNETSMFLETNLRWDRIMKNMNEKKVVVRATKENSLIKELENICKELEGIQKQLDNYLEVKRQQFPRFYFISDSDLLEILGNSKDPESVQRFLQNCFEGLYHLQIEEVEIKRVKTFVAKGMLSKEGEFVSFVSQIPLLGAAEKWLKTIESSMRTAIKKHLKTCYADLIKLKKDKSKWIETYAGQLLITSSQLFWTQKVEEAFEKGKKEKGVTKALKVLHKKVYPQILKKYSNTIRGKLTNLQRKKLIALLTIEVHGHDVIDMLIKSDCKSKDDFEWMKQLRFYWDENNSVEVCQTSAKIGYDYEYLGSSGRLVITPLTERCYITLTTAIHLCKGGNPKGPAGTGKTETVKDMGKSIAKFVLVFNCSDGLDYQSLGKMFSGLCQTGAWSCFDEFNRVDIEVLSVVAQQMRQIINAISGKQKSFIFEDQEIQLNPTCGIFVTMNPGYAGRTELPENLKALLRPIAMMVPDSSLISEIFLFSQGFDNNKELSRKISALYELMTQQLSKQYHYDFGLRNIIAVLNTAGKLKRELIERGDKEIDEESVLVKACKKVNLPKFTSDDTPLFFALIDDLFPGVEQPEKELGVLEEAIIDCLKENNLQKNDYIIERSLQLFDTKKTRHGVMVIGETMSGKSTCWKMLQKAMTKLKNKKVPEFQRVISYVINPKSMSNDELFGYYDKSREWQDGKIAIIMKKACIDTSPDKKWMIFDGPVDTLWIESMNSVLDSNKVLTLISSERITLSDQVSLLFEVEDLSVASPATISRCGMVYFDKSKLGWIPYYLSWVDKIIKSEKDKGLKCFAEVENLFKSNYAVFITELFKKKKECVELVETNEVSDVISFCNLYESLVENELKCTDKNYETVVLDFFVFSLIWSIGAVVDEKGRKVLDMLFREFCTSFPSKDTVYEYYFDSKSQGWKDWEDKVNKSWKPPENTEFGRILVPTVDTTRNSFIINSLIQKKRNVLVIGNVGTGKTSIINYVLSNLVERQYTTLTINFSARTSAKRLQEIYDNKLEKKSFGVYSPLSGKWLVAFMDDFNMPQKDIYGSQPPLEQIKFFIDYGFWYDRSSSLSKKIQNVQLIASMGPPGGGRQEISSRIRSRFNMINITMPSDNQLFRIYNTLLSHRLNKLEDIKAIVEKISRTTFSLYNLITSHLLPTPKKSHYIFNLRDLSKVFLVLQNKAWEF